VEKNGYPWRSLVTLENTTKVCRVKPTFHVYPRRALPGTPCVPTRAIFWDFPGYLWGMSEGIFLRMFWGLTELRDVSGIPRDSWIFLGYLGLDLLAEVPPLGLSWISSRWIIWDRLRLSGKPRKRL